VPAGEILDVLSRLVDKSLASADAGGDARFSQLQTLWQYGRDRLIEAGGVDRNRLGYWRLGVSIPLTSHFASGLSGPVRLVRTVPELFVSKSVSTYFVGDFGDPLRQRVLRPRASAL
jgi:hypothetical protein